MRYDSEYESQRIAIWLCVMPTIRDYTRAAFLSKATDESVIYLVPPAAILDLIQCHTVPALSPQQCNHIRGGPHLKWKLLTVPPPPLLLIMLSLCEMVTHKDELLSRCQVTSLPLSVIWRWGEEPCAEGLLIWKHVQRYEGDIGERAATTTLNR